MNYKFKSLVTLAIIGLSVASPKADVKIVQTQGKVMVRFGLDETWQKAQIGAILKNIDSILSGEGGKVSLDLEDGTRFELGSNAILDISDIREIQQRELFMYLMSQKIDQLETKDKKTRVKVGNVSIVHGEYKERHGIVDIDTVQGDWYPFEINGALALFHQHYYPNTIIKFIKIQNKYGSERDKGEIDYYIGRSFEALSDPGQARDAYQRALDEVKQNGSSDQAWVRDVRQALQRLE